MERKCEMRKESAGVTEALLKSAEQEFLAHGFHDASLRRISAESGVSTNSIYTRFGDKAGLFETLVKPAA
jgi:AcrR family transcriptional regulator